MTEYKQHDFLSNKPFGFYSSLLLNSTRCVVHAETETEMNECFVLWIASGEKSLQKQNTVNKTRGFPEYYIFF